MHWHASVVHCVCKRFCWVFGLSAIRGKVLLRKLEKNATHGIYGKFDEERCR